MSGLSNGGVDRIGKRLRDAERPDPADVAADIEWSATFEEPSRETLETVDAASKRAAVALDELTSRIKQLYSTVAEPRRGHSRLSSIDDIVGCRAVVERETDVNALVLQLATAQVKHVRDDREEDRNGYRAVHMTIVYDDGKSVELQLRTEIQHVWAGLSELRAAIVGHEVRYGGGPQGERDHLRELSAIGRRLDLWQVSLDTRQDMLQSGRLSHIDEPQMHDLKDETRRLIAATDDFIAICGGYASIQGSL